MDRTRLRSTLDLNTSRLIKDYKLDIKKDAQDKVLYYLKRDFLGYSRIDVLMRDPRIEDISCDGVGIPIYVWHRDYESIPTNVQFAVKEELGFIHHPPRLQIRGTDNGGAADSGRQSSRRVQDSPYAG